MSRLILGVLQGEHDDEEYFTRMKSKVKKLMKTMTTGEMGAKVPLAALPLLLQDLANIELNQDDVAMLVSRTAPAPAPPSKRRRGVSSVSSAAPALQDELEPRLEQEDVVVQYDDMGAGDLQALLHQRKRDIESLKNAVHVAQQKASRYKIEKAALCGEMQSLKERHAALVSLVQFRPGARNISVIGGYSITVRRRFAGGMVSAKACVALVAGSQVHGGFVSRHIAYRFEHRVFVAQYLKLTEEHQQMEDAADSARERGGHVVESFLIRGDATHQSALGLHKIHICTISTCFTQDSDVKSAIDADGNFDIQGFAPLTTPKAAADLQVVVDGTAKETYRLFKQELASTGKCC